MVDERRKNLTREAADIFLRLRDDPGNGQLLARRDAFCARGQAENDAYNELLKTWKASGVMRAGSVLRSLVIFLVLAAGAAYFGYQPARIALLADITTASVPESVSLSSGDLAVLDADSAVVDGTGGATRSVQLLEGAAFFDVSTGDRPFTVRIDRLTVNVTGTAFETALIDDTIFVGVTEGVVEVRDGAEIWRLQAGDHLEWSKTAGGTISQRQADSIAAWRSDRLTVDGMTLGQAAAIIDRRLTGPVLFTSDALKDVRVTGSLDLKKPLVALRILAQTGGGQVYDAAGVARLIGTR
ncbi:MAG: FecR domain-containing protein [Pseudomonadota bacterium]